MHGDVWIRIINVGGPSLLVLEGVEESNFQKNHYATFERPSSDNSSIELMFLYTANRREIKFLICCIWCYYLIQ